MTEEKTYIPSIGGEQNAFYNDQKADPPKPEEISHDDMAANFPRLADAIAKESAASENPTTEGEGSMRDQIIEAIKTVYDPEIPVNIYELGLIYEVNIGEGGKVDVLMTLTSPGCPAAGMLPGDVEEKVRTVPGTGDVKVEVTFEPPWDQSMMTDEAKLELGFM